MFFNQFLVQKYIKFCVLIEIAVKSLNILNMH